MSIDRSMRASDRDRDQVAKILCDAYAAGRLGTEEFGECSTTAYLMRFTHDLTREDDDPPGGPANNTDAPFTAVIATPMLHRCGWQRRQGGTRRTTDTAGHARR